MSRTPEEIRAEAVTALMGPGQERLDLALRMSEVDARLRPLVGAALSAGISITRIREITGLARGTIRAWSDDPGK